MSGPWVIGSFLIFLIAFALIGVASAWRKRETTDDYLLASRDVHPWMSALSAISTNNSGFMFIGLIGFAYRSGVQAAWLMLGWIVGDLLTWFYVHRRVRSLSEAIGAASVPTLLAVGEDGNVSRPIVIAAGILTFIFLGGYAAAQLNAGSTTLFALFGWPMWTGAVIGAAVVVLYCFSGGIRASIWTDSAQSAVMIVAMAVLLWACYEEAGGPAALFATLEGMDPALVRWIPEDLAFGFGLYLTGFVFAGIGTIGQPHILIRFMAIESPEAIPRARRVYFVWYVLFSAAAVLVGLYSRAILPDLAAASGGALAQATELALPKLAVALLPNVLIGLMLAGIFSASMSTADSQILSCSAAVTQDVFPRWRSSYWASKIATLGVAALALGIALVATQGVFDLVLVAWSVLGAALGPILVVRLARQPLSDGVALVMMATGVAVVFAWDASPFAGGLFKLAPGMLAPTLIYLVARVAGLMPDVQRGEDAGRLEGEGAG